MAEELIKELIKKYRKDIVMLDGLLQWALNPTSMSAGYGIEENYQYIEQNLEITHELTSSEANEAVEMLRLECNKFLEFKKNKYDIGNYQKIIIDELSKLEYVKLFENLLLKRKKTSSKNAIRFKVSIKSLTLGLSGFHFFNFKLSIIISKNGIYLGITSFFPLLPEEIQYNGFKIPN
ncbi:unnamed protein product [marine sediment metagenome]|uniref:Uncharacterized protein n=1 Tax=marine sediment metagenome TaxID=412755 RepID=X1HCJ1_9ZZZZ